MTSKSPPQAPDPKATIAAQSQANSQSALQNAELNRITQNTPYGSSKYTISGYNPDGTPQYTQDVTLAPAQQQLLDIGNKGAISLGNTATGLLDRVGNAVSTPLSTADLPGLTQKAQDAAYRSQTQYLDPQFQQGQEQLDNSLINQGITQGSEAYNNAQGNFGRQRQAAYQSAQDAATTAGFDESSRALSQLFALRNQPLNEYNALMTGAQVQNPTFGSVPSANVATTDVAGINNSAYQNQLARYQQQMAGYNNLFGLAGSLGSAAIMG